MTWSEAFKAHLEKRGLNQQDAVFDLRRSRIRVTPSQVHYWCHGARPREKTRERIDRWSGGDVPATAESGSSRSLPSTGSD